MTLYAEVAVNTEAPYRSAFSYRVPDDLLLTAGQGVLVPFGPRTLQGVVVRLTPTTSFEGEVRQVAGVAADLPALGSHQLALACWLAEQTLAPLFACIALMLPPGAERRPRYRLAPTGRGEATNEPQRALLDALREAGPLDPVRLQQRIQIPRFNATAKALLRSGTLRRDYELAPQRVGPRFERWLRLTDAGRALAVDQPTSGALANLGFRASADAEHARLVLAHLSEAGGALPLRLAREHPSWRESLLARFVDAGLVETNEERLLRDPLAGHAPEASGAPMLTPAQRHAVERILDDGHGRPRVFLLHGVTGSGKTEVYLAAVAETVARGQRVILLVPEIALTPQMIERFSGRFRGRVAILHSGLSDGQRYDQWQAVRDGRYAVVIGSRSAIFAPVADLGLIVLDEEHEWTYKQQDSAPRYHARDVAERLATLTGAALVLASATPDVVSYQRALRGRYELIELPERIHSLEGGLGWQTERLPRVQVVDLARELREGNRGIFSRALQAALSETLAAGDQAILFLNRRGSASFVLCRDCGHVPTCRRCTVSLTFHASVQRLLCHQCNRSRRAPVRCPRCRSQRIRYFGLGTQRVEDEVARQFPQARVLRWDRDAARRARDHAEIYERLRRGEADVLVGTQMVAKGLDLPKIALVGVVNADVSLNVPEFRSGERAFQLLTQVAGRAGRRDRPGHVILQTYAPNHYALVAASRHDYAGFFAQEIEFRSRGLYPPFARLTRLVYAHSNRVHGEQEARRTLLELRGCIAERRLLASEVLGPAPCLVERLRGRWRWQLLLRCPEPAALLRNLSLPPGWSVDIDPISFS